MGNACPANPFIGECVNGNSCMRLGSGDGGELNAGIRCERHRARSDLQSAECGWGRCGRHALLRPRSARRSVVQTVVPLVLVGIVLQLGLTPLAAQFSPLDTTSVGQADYSTMSTLLEKTIFQG